MTSGDARPIQRKDLAPRVSAAAKASTALSVSLIVLLASLAWLYGVDTKMPDSYWHWQQAVGRVLFVGFALASAFGWFGLSVKLASKRLRLATGLGCLGLLCIFVQLVANISSKDAISSVIFVVAWPLSIVASLAAITANAMQTAWRNLIVLVAPQIAMFALIVWSIAYPAPISSDADFRPPSPFWSSSN